MMLCVHGADDTFWYDFGDALCTFGADLFMGDIGDDLSTWCW